MWKKCWAIALFLTGLTVSSALQASDTVRIVSLEWPPFAGKNLPGGGSSLKLIRDVFAKSGIRVEYVFLPWNRALTQFMQGHFDAIAPEYYNRHRQKACHFSRGFQSSPLGFLTPKAVEVTWRELSDLRDRVIGTVAGYANTIEFDQLVDQGVLRVEPVSNDETNILKVANGRIPMAVIDANVLDYLLRHQPRLQGLREKVHFNKKILESKQLFVCFSRNQRGWELKGKFDRFVYAHNLTARQWSYAP